MRKWTEEELDLLKSGKTVREVMTLTNRTDSSVRGKAKRLGIEMKASPTVWTEEEIEYLTKNVRRCTYQSIANRLGRTPEAVGLKAHELGISFHAKSNIRKKWTEEEDLYLENNYSKSSMKRLCLKLDRSAVAIRSRARLLGLTRDEHEFITASQLSECFGRDKIVACNWIRHYGLPCHKLGDDTNYIYQIDIEEFWKWADTHRHIIDWQGYKRYSLLPEPSFVEECIQEYSKPKKHRSRITRNEKSKIYRMYCKGIAIKEIADEHSRTEYAIKHILRSYQSELRHSG